VRKESLAAAIAEAVNSVEMAVIFEVSLTRWALSGAERTT